MRRRDIFLTGWLILAAIAALVGGGIDKGIINIWGVLANVFIWLLIFKTIFFIYDKVKK